MTEKTQSKNPRAERIVGLRGVGIPILSTWELGFYCPICKREDIPFSEYTGFLWCDHCNRDIPTFLCINPKYLTEEHIPTFTESYLDFIEETQNRILKKRKRWIRKARLKAQVSELHAIIDVLKKQRESSILDIFKKKDQ